MQPDPKSLGRCSSSRSKDKLFPERHWPRLRPTNDCWQRMNAVETGYTQGQEYEAQRPPDHRKDEQVLPPSQSDIWPIPKS